MKSSIIEAQNYSMLSLAFIASSYRVTEEIAFIIRNCTVLPTLFLFYICTALLFVVTVAGVVLCGGSKMQPRISTIVKFIFFFWSFEISGSENIIGLDSCILNWCFAIQAPLGFISIFRLTTLLKLKITECFLWLSLLFLSGSLKIIYYSKLYSLAHPLSFECFHCS